MGQMRESQWQMMGTVITMKIPETWELKGTGKANVGVAEPLLQTAEAYLRQQEQRFSANSPTSELAQVNQLAGSGQWLPIHPQLFDLIAIGRKHSLASGSQLNIAIGPLVQTWRIGFDDAKVPSPQAITQLLGKTDPQKIQLDFNKKAVLLEESGMKIDLGALAKGYIADCLMTKLRQAQVPWAMLNLGGNLVVYGENPNQVDNSWHIGIQDPTKQRNHTLALLRLTSDSSQTFTGQWSVVTSGIYERHLHVGDREYHHILNPQTGYPQATDVISLTILSHESILGEIWTTRLFGKNKSEILTCVEALPDMEALVIDKELQISETSGVAALLL